MAPRARHGHVGGQEGIYRSSVNAGKPQNPINSEEYQGSGGGARARQWHLGLDTGIEGVGRGSGARQWHLRLDTGM
eukprot:558637-Prorocentrum_minimum.AAC.1